MYPYGSEYLDRYENPFTIEFFKELKDAERWASDPVRASRVIGVYGLKKRGTVRDFKDWLDTAIDSGWVSEYSAEVMTACVLVNG